MQRTGKGRTCPGWLGPAWLAWMLLQHPIMPGCGLLRRHSPTSPLRGCAGVDVGSLLSKIGLQVTDTSEKVGTFAIAYAAHKALSPVRFPPTVALTPLVARWLGQKPAAESVDKE